MYQVFRIEHKTTRVGPFQTNDPFTQGLAQRATQSRYLRCPGDDGLSLANIPWHYVFGCPSLETLKRWFFLGRTVEENEAIVQELDTRGFVLREYLVEDDVIFFGRSHLQVVFDASHCRREGLVEQHSLAALLQSSPFVLDVC